MENDPNAPTLYIAENPKIPGEVKVGKSYNPLRRASGLSEGQNFRLRVIAVFPGLGYLETTVHGLLERQRVEDAPSREWFYVSPQFAMAAVEQARAAA